MFYKFRKSLAAKKFYRLTREILDSPPMPVVHAPLVFVSMVSNSDVQMYLLSMKACYQRIGRGRIVAIIDRDMPAASRDLISRHFPGIDFQILEDIKVGPCQRGGTWERVIYMVKRSHDEYAIQIDCDTLAFGPDLSEVQDCIRENRSFTLSGGERDMVDMPEAAVRARKIDHPHVTMAIESRFDEYPNAANLRYVRGSSGFAGFAKGGFNLGQLEEFHEVIKGWFPDRYKEWGTEQIASNFAISNAPGGIVLPFPKYANYVPDDDTSTSSFLHFIGTYRYDNDFFANAGKRVIAELRAPRP